MQSFKVAMVSVIPQKFNPLGPVAPKVARIFSSLHDNSDNSHAITPPITHRLCFQWSLVPATLHTLTSICNNFTFQWVVNLDESIGDGIVIIRNLLSQKRAEDDYHRSWLYNYACAVSLRTPPTQIMTAWISPTRVIKYFSGEEGGLSEVCFDGSDNDLGMEDEEPYDPPYMSDDEGMHNSQKIIIIWNWHKYYKMLRSFNHSSHFASNHCTWTNKGKFIIKYVIE